MNDPVFDAFLERQYLEGMELAQSSPIVELRPFGGSGRAVTKYVARFSCDGLVENGAGDIVPAHEFYVGTWFHPGYLRRVEPREVLTLLHPERTWHPNINWPYVCAGYLPPGTPLVSILHQVYEILTYHLWSPHDALNPRASQWARNHADRFPLDRRPLRHRASEPGRRPG